MSSRRQSAATPASSRRQRQSATATPAPARVPNEPATSAANPPRAGNFPLPPYQEPAAPLTANAQQTLSNILTRSHPTTKIAEHLKRASAALEESTSEINERFVERENILKKRRAKRAQNGAEDAALDEKENEDVAVMRSKVEAMTERIDGAMRKCIDGEVGIERLETTLKELSRSAANALQQAQVAEASQRQLQQQQATQARTQTQTQTQTQEPDATPEVTQPGTTQAPSPSQERPPTAPTPPSLTPAFTATLQSRTDAYMSLSLRTRYSEHPDYVAFKKLTWDAQHPGDEVPPMPHASTWFAKEEGRRRGPSPAPGVTGGAPAPSGDADTDDLAIARIRISTRCPLTLREFEDPVSSTKCSHSFERAAIMGMIAQQRPETAGGRSGRGQHAAAPAGWAPHVQCPVAGCSSVIGREDLVSDKVLVRRIKRVQREKAMGGGGGGGSEAVEGEDDGGYCGGGRVVDDVDGTVGDDGDGEAGDDIDDVGEDESDDDDVGDERPRNGRRSRRRTQRAVSDDIEDEDDD